MHGKSVKILTLLVCILFLFAGCTQAEKIDVMEFCKQFNQLENEKILLSSSFFETKEPSGTFLHANCKDGNNPPVFFSIKTDEKGVISSLQLTLLTQGNQKITKEEQENLFGWFLNSVSILKKESPQKTKNLFASFHFSADTLCFSQNTLQKEDGKWRLTLLSRREGISLFYEHI